MTVSAPPSNTKDALKEVQSILLIHTFPVHNSPTRRHALVAPSWHPRPFVGVARAPDTGLVRGARLQPGSHGPRAPTRHQRPRCRRVSFLGSLQHPGVLLHPVPGWRSHPLTWPPNGALNSSCLALPRAGLTGTCAVTAGSPGTRHIGCCFVTEGTFPS